MMVGIVLTFAIAAFALTSVVIAQESNTHTVESVEPDPVERVEIRTDAVNERIAELEARATERREQAQSAREEAVTKAKEDRIAACTSRKDSVQSSMQTVRLRGESFKQKIDYYVNRVDKLVTSGYLTIADYETVRLALDLAEAEAQTDINVVKALRAEFDCQDPDSVRESIDTYKAAVNNFRESAKTYLTTAKDFAAAVKASLESEEG